MIIEWKRHLESSLIGIFFNFDGRRRSIFRIKTFQYQTIQK